MQYRDLARTGVRVSQYALGGGVFGSLASKEEGIRIIHKALDAGITLIDTSNRYGDGESERIIGEAIKGRRDGLLWQRNSGRSRMASEIKALPAAGFGKRSNKACSGCKRIISIFISCIAHSGTLLSKKFWAC